MTALIITTVSLSFAAGLLTREILRLVFKKVNDKNSIETFNEYNEN